MSQMTQNMEHIGVPRFFGSHSASVRAVAFNPAERHLFASGGNDGNICVYHAGRGELLNTFTVINSGLNRHISAVRYTHDGKKILSVTTSRRLTVLDAERGSLVTSYENCAFSGRERAALATDPQNPNLAVCSYVNGKGLTMLDLRMPLPLDFLFDFHTDPIRDIQYLDASWPFTKSGQSQCIMSLSSQGHTKISTLDGGVVHHFDYGQATNTVVATPELFGSAATNGFTSALLAGGTSISSYAPTPRGVAHEEPDPEADQRTINVIRRSHSGSSVMEHDGGGDEEPVRPNQPPLQSRRSEISFSLDRFRISRQSLGGGGVSSGVSGVSSASVDQVVAQPRYLHFPTHSQQGAASTSSSSAAALRQHLINQMNAQMAANGHRHQVVAADGVPSVALGAIGSNPVQAINLPSGSLLNGNPLRSNLQQFLLQNLQSYRTPGSIPQYAIATIQPGPIINHDPWDLSLDSDISSPPSPTAAPVGSLGNGNFLYVVNGVLTTNQPATMGGNSTQQIWRLRYSKSGALLFATGDGGSVRRYRQCPGQELKCLGDLYKHKGDVVDMDISPYDEYLVTASKDKTVGLYCLGAPSHGSTEYYELT